MLGREGGGEFRDPGCLLRQDKTVEAQGPTWGPLAACLPGLKVLEALLRRDGAGLLLGQ